MNINEGFEKGDEILLVETHDSTDNLPNIAAIEDSMNSEASKETQTELNIDQFLDKMNDFEMAQNIYLLASISKYIFCVVPKFHDVSSKLTIFYYGVHRQ